MCVDFKVKSRVLEDKTNEVAAKNNGGVSPKTDDAPQEKRYRTRASAPLTKPEELKKPEPPKPKPFIEYKGKIEYATEMTDVAFMSDGLL